jgi:hypothetical protein
MVGTKEGDTEGDLGDVAMPGFVDILSSVLTVFMFFMMLTAAIMFMLTIELKKNLVKEKEKAVSQELTEFMEKIKSGEIDVSDLKKKAEQTVVLQEEKEELTSDLSNAVQQVARLQDNQAVYSRAAEISSSQTDDPSEFVILYREMGISISVETQAKIAEFVKKLRRENPGKKIKILLEAPDDPNSATLTVSRQVVLGRTMNVRNALLGGKANPQEILIQNLSPEKIKDSYQWVRIRVQVE